MGIAFKLYDPDHLVGDREEIGITVCYWTDEQSIAASLSTFSARVANLVAMDRALALPAFDSGDVNLLPEYIGSLVRKLEGTATGEHAASVEPGVPQMRCDCACDHAVVLDHERPAFFTRGRRHVPNDARLVGFLRLQPASLESASQD